MFITLHGTTLFYARKGRGRPVVLVHGNGEDHTIFGPLARRLAAEGYCVYAPDSRGHGQSGGAVAADYETMADDMAAFIDALHLKKPVFIGFSDGGIVGLLLAARCPGLLAQLVVCGANTSPEGTKRRWRALMQLGYLATRDAKLKLMLTQPHITEAQLAAIRTPTLVLAGSRDMIVEAHTRRLAAAIPHASLRILPGETHAGYVANTDKLAVILRPFLGAGRGNARTL